MSNTRVREIYKVFDNVNESLAQQTVQYDEQRLNSLLKNVYSPGPSFQYVFDFPNKKFLYVSDGANKLFGVDPLKLTPEIFVNRIHPDDIEHYVHCQEIAAFFLFRHIKKESIPHYKVSFQFRIKDIDENYRLFLHQAIALAVDENFNISSSFANHSIVDHITTINNFKMSFIDVLGNKSYFGINKIEDLKNMPPKSSITQRETEILKLISEGYSSKEISNYLRISLDTVSTHRKNILKKTKFRNMPQTIRYCINEGLI
ncbi:LuxR C-terminal-related transcriptional regulator [Allomuricauda sp. SCSIO 65647]|uniref:LuxR C-terminal-related transcriptional regulator n=1 Tax=Allomuricauda sp. SCSIO 65647 TaxID=2908843 RepID=UPI001F28C331|nr:LuxR C-terminal-related transcriptional regulator [Muricauda sp. SCSIO 65647]UJH67639.1 LuxR C-terminal-related transcriptional regulator [Muricauda sp. SCSIO 65647]